MPKPQRYQPEEVANALQDSHGIVQRAAAALQCHPSTVYRYVDRYSEVEEALKEARVDTYAMAEAALFKMAEDANSRHHRWAVDKVLRMFSPLVDDGNDWHIEAAAQAEASAQVVVQVNYPTETPLPDSKREKEGDFQLL